MRSIRKSGITALTAAIALSLGAVPVALTDRDRPRIDDGTHDAARRETGPQDRDVARDRDAPGQERDPRRFSSIPERGHGWRHLDRPVAHQLQWHLDEQVRGYESNCGRLPDWFDRRSGDQVGAVLQPVGRTTTTWLSPMSETLVLGLNPVAVKDDFGSAQGEVGLPPTALAHKQRDDLSNCDAGWHSGGCPQRVFHQFGWHRESRDLDNRQRGLQVRHAFPEGCQGRVLPLRGMLPPARPST